MRHPRIERSSMHIASGLLVAFAYRLYAISLYRNTIHYIATLRPKQTGRIMNVDRLILLSNVTLGMKTETYKRFLHQNLSASRVRGAPEKPPL